MKTKKNAMDEGKQTVSICRTCSHYCLNRGQQTVGICDAQATHHLLAICSRIVHGCGMPDDNVPPPLMPGQLLARGVSRAMRSHDFVSVEELVPTSGLRVDVMALGPKGEIWIVECKSSKADFQSDHKWQGYLEW